jgi:hypothetical protein
MRFLSFTAIFLVILSGCASYRTKGPVEAVSKSNQPKRIEPTETKGPAVPPSSGALWEILGEEQIALQLKNVDDGTNLTVNLTKGFSTTPLPGVHWELTGVEEAGKSFLSMNTSKKFVFSMKQKKNVYAGSIVIGCPKIAPTNFKLLKEMKFFNRYPFSSSTGLCELVVGNNFAKV